jgi:hypothetical protein
LQEFPYARHQFDHFNRLLTEIITAAVKTFGFLNVEAHASQQQGDRLLPAFGATR